MQERLRAIFRDTFDLDADADVDHLTYRGVAAWDSVGHMRLVAALESDFNVMMDTDQVIDLSSFAKAVDIISLLAAE